MPLSKLSLFAGVLAFTTAARAHFRLFGVKTDQEYSFESNAPQASGQNSAGWHSNSQDHNSVNPVNQGAYKTQDFVCGRKYVPGNIHAKVAAGGTVTVRWTNLAPNHRGPILDYLAPCNGPCNQADIMGLQFTKIAQTGLVEPGKAATALSGPLGIWGTDLLFRTRTNERFEEVSGPDKLQGDNVHWEVKIPEDFAPGFYVLREEIIALFAGKDDTQHYPRCVNLEITGSGTAKPEGVVAANLYRLDEPGITARTWENLKSYSLPGPALYQGGSVSSSSNGTSGEGTSSNINSNVVSSGGGTSGSSAAGSGAGYPDSGSSSSSSSSSSRASSTSTSASPRSTQDSSNENCEPTATVTVTVTASEASSANPVSTSQSSAQASASTPSGGYRGSRRGYRRL